MCIGFEWEIQFFKSFTRSGSWIVHTPRESRALATPLSRGRHGRNPGIGTRTGFLMYPVFDSWLYGIVAIIQLRVAVVHPRHEFLIQRSALVHGVRLARP